MIQVRFFLYSYVFFFTIMITITYITVLCANPLIKSNGEVVNRDINEDYDIEKQPISRENHFSDVYKGISKTNNKVFAIKKFRMNRQSEADVLKEYNIGLLFDHENIIKTHEPLYKHYEPKSKTSRMYMVLEYCNGERLSDFMHDKEVNGVEYQEVVKILKDVLSGLNVMHQKNITHGDLMLNNLVFNDGVIKIIDLGYASHSSEPKKHFVWWWDRRKCRHYAPEVLRGHAYTPKSDMFAFGYLMNRIKTMIFKFKNDEEKKLYDLYYDDLIKKCMRYDAEERISATEALKHMIFKILP